MRFHKKDLEKTLAFKLPGDWVLEHEKDWMEVPGMECTGLGQCETVVRTKIQILHVSHRWRSARVVFGNFVVSLNDGRKLEGSFSARFIKPSAQIICE